MNCRRDLNQDVRGLDVPHCVHLEQHSAALSFIQARLFHQVLSSTRGKGLGIFFLKMSFLRYMRDVMLQCNNLNLKGF